MAGKSSKKRQQSTHSTPITTRMAEMKDGILQMESFIKEAAVLAQAEGRRIEKISKGFEEAVARLRAELREKDETLRNKGSVLQELERSTTSHIGDLEDQLRKKDELLENQVAELQAAGSSAQDKRLMELKTQLKEKEELLFQKDAMVRELQEGLAGLTAQVGVLENQVRTREGLLESRDGEIRDLKSKIDGLQVLPQGSVALREENVILLEDPEPRAEQQPSDVKVKMIEQSMRGIVGRQGKIIGKEPGKEPKKSRLISLLAPSKK